MRQLIAPLAALFATTMIVAGSAKDPRTDDKPLDVPIPAGATHIQVKEGDADFRQLFTYFPYPQYPRWLNIIPPNSSGVYRVEINPEGKVTAVTILKTLGKRLDALIMKNFLTWKRNRVRCA
jgi:hypothetical protein